MQLATKQKLNFKKQQGATIVELVIGAAVGLFVLLAANGLYLAASTDAKETRSINTLNQNMRVAMDIMSADIRRAGHYVPAAGGTISNNVYAKRYSDATNTITDLRIVDNGTCILYSYDRMHAGDNPVPASNFFGFRLNANTQELETLDGAGSAMTTTALDTCDGLTWLPMNLPERVRFSDLQFTRYSECVGMQEITDVATGEISTVSATWTHAARNTDDKTESATCVVPGGTPITSSARADLSLLESRTINLTLTGHFNYTNASGEKADSDLAKVPDYLERTMISSIKVANDYIRMAGE